MGYKSEVKIAMKNQDYEELKERLEIVGNNILDYQDHIIENPMSEVTIICFDWINWDETDSKVSFIMDYLAELREYGKPFQMIRLGERYNDIEEHLSYGESGSDCDCEVLSIIHEIKIN